MRRWDRLVDAYVEECRVRGLSPGTLVKRRAELERWGGWLKRRRPRPRIEEVDAELIVTYLRARMAFRAKSTAYGTMSEMRCMGEFLVRQGIWSSNPLRWLRGPRLDARSRLPRRIGASQMEQLWSAVASHRRRHTRYLWTAVLGVFYGTGLRRGELIRLNLDDWDRQTGLLAIDGRKTGEPRRVPVPELTARCLEVYLPHRQLALERQERVESSALFVGERGRRLSGQTVSQTVHRLARSAGLDGVTLHAFRHSCASDLLEAGVRLPEVQKILGHRSLPTTVRYLQIADPARHAAMRRHPINDGLQEDAA